MVWCCMLCYSLGFVRETCERSHVPSPARAPCKPLPPVIWFNDQKIVDRVNITRRFIRGSGWGEGGTLIQHSFFYVISILYEKRANLILLVLFKMALLKSSQYFSSTLFLGLRHVMPPPPPLWHPLWSDNSREGNTTPSQSAGAVRGDRHCPLRYQVIRNLLKS